MRIPPQRPRPRPPLTWLVLALALPSPAAAEPTLELRVSGPQEVFAGDPESSSVDARGVIGLGPPITKLAQVGGAPITSLVATDRAMFAGTAGGGLFRIEPGAGAKSLINGDKVIYSALALHEGKLFAATSPDGRIVSIEADGKPKPYFDPSEKYVWAMLSDAKGLLVATGEPGRVLQVGPGGRSQVLFTPEETHVRALIRHPTRGVIAGGGQKGIVYQLGGKAAFALYDSGMDEVTGFAVDPASGDLYAAFVSESKPGAILTDKSIGPVASDPAETGSPIKGSEVVRIAASGRVDVLWTSRREGALAVAFDAKARQLYLATGASGKARGRIYAIDLGDRDRVRLLARVEPPIASTLAVADADRSLVVGTAPAGELLRIGPGQRKESIYVSSEQELERSSRIGRIWFDADVPEGGTVEISARTGNTKQHDATWSEWSAPIQSSFGGPVTVPEGRYLQIRARLGAGKGGKSPAVKSLHASVVRRNVAPEVQEVFLLRPGVYLRPMPAEEEKEKTLTMSPSALQRLRRQDDESRDVRVRQGVTPGMLSVGWRAEDRNKDELLFRVEIRRVDTGGDWQRLTDDEAHTFFSFDTRAYPDGRYQIRISASDRPSNAPSEALQDANLSDVFSIDNTAPLIRSLAARPSQNGVQVTVEAEDATSSLGKAELSLNGGPWLMLPAADGLTDARQERFEADVKAGGAPGQIKLDGKRISVAVRVEDEIGNAANGATTIQR